MLIDQAKLVVAALAVAACVSSKDDPKLESLLPPLSDFTGACRLAPYDRGGMGSYSNPHVSSEPGFLKLMASLGGDSIPQSGLREAAVAYYGQLPTKFTGLVLFRFKDEVAAESAAHAVASKSKFESRIYRTDVFRKGTVVAMSWERRDAEATCLTPILRHYEEGAFAKTDR